jgi:preprotein translocase subunit SecE
MKGKAKSLRDNPIINYFEESYQEIRKVSWPTKTQAIRLTFLVLGFCFVTAAIIGAFDFGFSEGYKSLKRYSDTVVPPAPIQAPVASPVTTTTGAEQPISVTGANGQPIQVDATGAQSGQPITITSAAAPTAATAPVPAKAPTATPTAATAPVKTTN